MTPVFTANEAFSRWSRVGEGCRKDAEKAEVTGISTVFRVYTKGLVAVTA